jgi:hypothetical protein
LGLEGHGHRVVNALRPVVEAGKDVAVKIDQRPGNGTLRAPR